MQVMKISEASRNVGFGPSIFGRGKSSNSVYQAPRRPLPESPITSGEDKAEKDFRNRRLLSTSYKRPKCEWRTIPDEAAMDVTSSTQHSNQPSQRRAYIANASSSHVALTLQLPDELDTGCAQL